MRDGNARRKARPKPMSSTLSGRAQQTRWAPGVLSSLRLGLVFVVSVVLVVSIITVASVARAQSPQPIDEPRDRRPALPDFEPPANKERRILPEIQFPSTPGTGSLSAGLKLHVKGFRVSGNTVFSDKQLLSLISGHAGRVLGYSDLENLRDKLTYAYISAGYVSSGAVIPDQEMEDGVVEFQIVEGKLSEVVVNSKYFRESYFKKRLERTTGGVVNVHVLDEQLQLLQDDPRIRKVDAELLPGDESGSAKLKLDVSEQKPFRASLEANNYASPSIGAYTGGVRLGYDNAIGIGDAIDASFTVAEGLYFVAGGIEIPLNRYDTALRLYGSYSESVIVDKDFDDLDIESESSTIGWSLIQPAYQSKNANLDVFFTGERRRSKSFLLGDGWSFSPGVEDGVSKVSALRFGADGVYRDRSQVFAARTTVSVGIDALVATTNNDSGIADGKFVSWLTQFQWARRFSFLDTLLIFHADLQLSDDPLFGMEQFSVGGHTSVRGYRENLFVSDNGVLLSLDARVPILKRTDGSPVVQLGPIFDAGRVWSNSEQNSGPEWLYSIGLAGSWAIGDHADLSMSWSQELNNVDIGAEHDLQDSGFFFQLIARY